MLRQLCYTKQLLNLTSQFYYENIVFLQTVRWRKRRWAPVSAEKKYFVPVKPEVNLEEYEELKSRYAIYHTELKTLRKYFLDQSKEEKMIQLQTRSRYDTTDFDVLSQENKVFNKQSAKIRNEREMKEEMAREAAEIDRLKNEMEEDRLRKERAKRMILNEQEAAKSFIDVENLDQEIESILDSRTNYNFAIDLAGNKYVGMPNDQEVKSEITVRSDNIETTKKL